MKDQDKIQRVGDLVFAAANTVEAFELPNMDQEETLSYARKVAAMAEIELAARIRVKKEGE